MVATASVASGSLYLASGSIFLNTFASGVLGTSGGLPTAWGNSGATTVGRDLDKSGYTVSTNIDKTGYTLLSGQSYTASGIFVNATATVNSGLFVNVPISSISGVFSVVLPATLSGVIANSGLFVSVPTSSISGVNTASTVGSGQIYLNSGWPASLLTYDHSGLSSTPVHTTVNAERKLTNKWDTATSGYLTVYLEDASTTAYTQPLTSQSGAQPITSLGDA